jgi:uncharacterized protein
VEISYDPVKRATVLRTRGLDFDDAARILAGLTFTQDDDRYDYGELRSITYGLL